VLLVEWPERGLDHLPPADLSIRFEYAGAGRLLRWQGHTGRGEAVCQSLADLMQQVF
jgi:tRNA A37 threonylcarbamoyladenosine biosynthesis protein TsaE